MVHGWHAIVEHIDSSQIHLWLAYLDEITDPRLLDRYRSLLNEEELQQQARFRFERVRHRYLVTRAMVRTVLSKYADIAPREWAFVNNPYGKPQVSNGDAWARRLAFNVSHSDRIVLLGVALDRALGVDVEDMTGDRASVDLAGRFFAPEEVRALYSLPPEWRARRFFEYWTLKESYIKARGMGLSIPLERFAFHLEDAARIRLTIDSTLRDYPERWTFWRLELRYSHAAAVCAEQTQAERPDLTPPRTWPLQCLPR